MPYNRRLGQNFLCVCVLVAAASVSLYAQANTSSNSASAAAQESTAPPQPQPGTVTAPPGKLQDGPGQPVEDKRAFGVLPNYKTARSECSFCAAYCETEIHDRYQGLLRLSGFRYDCVLRWNIANERRQ